MARRWSDRDEQLTGVGGHPGPTGRRPREAVGEAGPTRVPVVLPLVEVRIDAAGDLDVTLDHEPYPLGSSWAGRGRRALGPVVEQIATELAQPVRVEVREADGSVFTDILTPPPAPRPAAALEAPSPAEPDTRGILELGLEPGEVTGHGFTPGEDVAVAVVIARQPAGADGIARLRLPPALVESRGGQLLFVGRDSGTVSRAGPHTGRNGMGGVR